MRHVAITGVGFLHPAVAGSEGLGRALATERPPPRQLASLDYGGYFPAGTKRAKRMDRLGKLAVIAARLALDDAGLSAPPDPERAGLIAGTTFGGLEACAAFHSELVLLGPALVNHAHFPNTSHNVAGAQAAIELQIKGPVLTLASGLAAGLDAVVAATRTIRAGRADLVLTGGFDAWTPALESTLQAAGLLAAEPGGAGLQPAEAACFLVLEEAASARRRGARCRGTVLGYGQASAMAGGKGLARAIRRALAAASDPPLAAAALGVQGVPAYDAAVMAAYDSALAEGWEKLPRWRPKLGLGETFGAAGPLSIAFALSVAGSPPGAVVVDGLSWGGAATALIVRGGD